MVGALTYMGFFYLRNIYLGSIGRGKVGLSGNILVKKNIPKSKFDVFDIRKEYFLYIQSMRKIHLLGFYNTTIVGKIFEISRNFSVGP